MTSPPPRAKSSARRTLILVGVALALLALAVWTNREQIQRVFARPIDPAPFVLGFALYVSGLLLTFYRWFVLVRALDLPIAFSEAVRLGFIGNVYNLVIPGAVGGDVIKAAFFIRSMGRKNRTRAISSVVIDRILGLSGLFLLGAVSGVVAWPSANPGLKSFIVAVWLCLAAALGILAVAFTPALYRPLNRLARRRPRLEGVLVELEFMANAYRSRLAVVAFGLALSTLIHTLNVLVFYMVSRALFYDDPNLPGLVQHYVITPMILFSTAIPLPFGALGLGEQIGGGLYEIVNYKGGAVVMMGFRVVMYAGGLLSVAVYLANLRVVRDLTATVEARQALDDAEQALHPDAPDPEMLRDVDPELESELESELPHPPEADPNRASTP